jgi:hypothetical protein
LPEGQQQLSTVGQPLEVTIKYGTLEKKIVGLPDQVARDVYSFLLKTIPELDLASQLALSVDVKDLAEACSPSLPKA